MKLSDTTPGIYLPLKPEDSMYGYSQEGETRSFSNVGITYVSIHNCNSKAQIQKFSYILQHFLNQDKNVTFTSKSNWHGFNPEFNPHPRV
jgi:hypothetical protein